MLVAVDIVLWMLCAVCAGVLAARYLRKEDAWPASLGAGQKAVIAVLAALSLGCATRVALEASSQYAVAVLGIMYCVALFAAVIDGKLYTIPNIAVIVLMAARAVVYLYQLLFTEEAVAYFVSSCAGCFLCYLALQLSSKITKGGVGAGDIKLISAMGFAGGVYSIMYTLLFSLIAVAVFSVILLLLKRKGIKDALPFAPFVFAGYAVSLLLALY